MTSHLTTDQIDLIKNICIDKTPLVMRNVFSDILSIEQFENLLNLNPFSNAKRFQTSWSIPQYTWHVPDWSTGNDHWPSSLVKEFLNQGTCYIRDCSKVNFKINYICKVLENYTNTPVDAHIYFNKNKDTVKSFGIHNDNAHNLIIQIQGETEWKVGSKEYKDGKRNIDKFFDDDEIIIDTVLQPGDIIFVPAHRYHYAKSLTKRISISFPIPTDDNLNNFEEREWIKWNA